MVRKVKAFDPKKKFAIVDLVVENTMLNNMHKGDSFEYMSIPALMQVLQKEWDELQEAYGDYLTEPQSPPEIIMHMIEEISDTIVCLKMLMYSLIGIYENLKKYKLPRGK